MIYDFDKRIDRSNTNCVKYDLRDVVFGNANVLPMWVADMDFETPDFVREAVIKRAEHPVYGYHFKDRPYYQAIAGRPSGCRLCLVWSLASTWRYWPSRRKGMRSSSSRQCILLFIMR